MGEQRGTLVAGLETVLSEIEMTLLDARQVPPYNSGRWGFGLGRLDRTLRPADKHQIQVIALEHSKFNGRTNDPGRNAHRAADLSSSAPQPLHCQHL